MTAFVDTSVIIYAVGRIHPYKIPCASILRDIERGALDAHISVEVIQELIYRFSSIRRKMEGIRIARVISELMNPGTLDTDDCQRAVGLFERCEVDPRDAFHAAWMLNRDIRIIISADKHFDRIPGIVRIDPKEYVSQHPALDV